MSFYRFSIHDMGRDFSLRHQVHTKSGSHPVCYKFGVWDPFPREKLLVHEAEHSSLSNADVNNAWTVTFTS